MSNPDSLPELISATEDSSDNDSASISDDGLFNSNLEDVRTENRTFRNIISLLVGRQSVRQTLRSGNAKFQRKVFYTSIIISDY